MARMDGRPANSTRHGRHVVPTGSVVQGGKRYKIVIRGPAASRWRVARSQQRDKSFSRPLHHSVVANGTRPRSTPPSLSGPAKGSFANALSKRQQGDLAPCRGMESSRSAGPRQHGSRVPPIAGQRETFRSAAIFLVPRNWQGRNTLHAPVHATVMPPHVVFTSPRSTARPARRISSLPKPTVFVKPAR